MALSILFMGTPDFAVPSLDALHAAGHDIRAVFTQPPRAAGRRGLETVPSPVHRRADEFGIAVHTPTSLRDAGIQDQIAALKVDVGIVIAYGLLLPKAILDAPLHGCFNGHASLLPRWRGAAPIQRAIIAGDGETGVCVMRMEAGLDTGPVALCERQLLDSTMTAGRVHDALATMTAQLMVKAMENLEAGTLTLTRQSEDGITYAKKIEKAEARIDWHRSAQEIHRQIMGLSPFPGAWCEAPVRGKNVRLKVLESRADMAAQDAEPGTVLDENLTIACGEGALRLTRVQPAGGKAMGGADFQRGAALAPGEMLT